jgi:hypothetical protein
MVLQLVNTNILNKLRQSYVKSWEIIISWLKTLVKIKFKKQVQTLLSGHYLWYNKQSVNSFTRNSFCLFILNHFQINISMIDEVIQFFSLYLVIAVCNCLRQHVFLFVTYGVFIKAHVVSSSPYPLHSFSSVGSYF